MIYYRGAQYRLVTSTVMARRAGKTLTTSDVARVLAEQPNNAGKSIEYLQDKWIYSDTFTLVRGLLSENPELGTTHTHAGSRTPTAPVIIDDNKNQVARLEGSYGAAPDFLILDGQHRVNAAREQIPPGFVDAYVGDKVVDKLLQQNEKLIAARKEVADVISDYMSSDFPGKALDVLRMFVKRGRMSQARLDAIRAERKKRNAAAASDPYRNQNSDIDDALDHALDFHPTLDAIDDDLDPNDFNVERTYLSIEELYDYDDIDAWLDTEPGELLDLGGDELETWAYKFRGRHFMEEVENGLPAIVIVDTSWFTGIADGRGRVNYAVGMNLDSVPVILLTEK